MKHLLIIGARGFGREVYHSAINSRGFGSEYDVKGYLDDKSDALAQFSGYPPIIGAVETYQIQPDDVFVCALGDVKWKKHYAQIIEQKGGSFISLIHNASYVAETAAIGKGCIVLAGALIQSDVRIGDCVTVQPYCVIGHDTTVGDYCLLNCYVFTGGGTSIGELVTIHPGGMIMPKIKIGDNAVIGMGSVVIRNVQANKTVFGNPAMEIEF